MPKTTICTEDDTTTDGLLAAPVESDGIWAAFQALRSGVRVATRGRCARATFVTALDGDGNVVRGREGVAKVLLLGYRLDGAASRGPRSFRPGR
ncbi:MAG: hypothetical protein M3245_03300 [Actinomycetota bacterium]|nr:hypothetical protein [Actinomycetota bacterium]